MIIAIVAMDEKRGIGINNTIPWHLPEDLKRFSKLTSGHSVLMGRKTYESLPEKFRPLPNRKNIVLTRNPESLDLPKDVEVISDLNKFAKNFPKNEKLWIIGGSEIYKLSKEIWDQVSLTLVKGIHKADAFFPEFEDDFHLSTEESDNPSKYCFREYIRKN